MPLVDDAGAKDETAVSPEPKSEFQLGLEGKIKGAGEMIMMEYLTDSPAKRSFKALLQAELEDAAAKIKYKHASK